MKNQVSNLYKGSKYELQIGYLLPIFIRNTIIKNKNVK